MLQNVFDCDQTFRHPQTIINRVAVYGMYHAMKQITSCNISVNETLQCQRKNTTSYTKLINCDIYKWQ